MTNLEIDFQRWLNLKDYPQHGNDGRVEAAMRAAYFAGRKDARVVIPMKPDNIFQSFWDKSLAGYKYILSTLE